MLLAQHDRDHISLHCVEELLRDVVGAYGVLEGQVEHVVSLHHVPTLVLFGTPGTDPDTRTIKTLSKTLLYKVTHQDGWPPVDLVLTVPAADGPLL